MPPDKSEGLETEGPICSEIFLERLAEISQVLLRGAEESRR
jgi:hypothetical protein